MKSWLYTSLLSLVTTLLVIAVGPDNGALAALPVTSAGPAAQQPLTAVSRLAAGYDDGLHSPTKTTMFNNRIWLFLPLVRR